KQAGEELRGVANLLRLNAQLVAASPIKLGELLSLLADLPKAPAQLLGGVSFDRTVTTVANEVVLRWAPFPHLQPGSNLERQDTKLQGTDRVLGARERSRVLLCEVAREARDTLQPRMPPPHRREDLPHQHLELARRSELAGEPFQLLLDRG